MKEIAPPSSEDGHEPTILDLELRLQTLKLQAGEDDVLQRAWQLLAAHEHALFETFHMHIADMWERLPISPSAITPQSLQKTQHRYIQSLFCAAIDQDYVADRLKVGLVHHRIGLDAHWYLASCSTLKSLLQDALARHLFHEPDTLRHASTALEKRFHLDMGIVMNAYVHADRRALKDSNRSLRRSQMMLQQAQELVGLAYWELRLPDGRLRSCMRAQSMLDTPPEATTGGLEVLRRRVHPQDLPGLDAAVRQAIAHGSSYDIRYRICRPGQPPVMVRERARADMRSNGIVRLFGTAQDISQQVSQLSRIEQLALYDDLTGLPNRANMMAALEKSLAEALELNQQLAVMFIDLDDFKEINDTLGHAAGDSVLVELANRLRLSLRSNELIARLSGDEFIVVAHNVDRGQAMGIAQRLTATLSQPYNVAGTQICSRASIGIALHPEDGQTSDVLIRNADTAMYAAKQQQCGIAGYCEQMRDKLLRRLTLSSRLSTALEAGNFELHFQPQVRLIDGRLMGAEALLRWNDPEMGSVPPGEFITLAENRGLISRLGDWVVDAACKQLLDWENAGFGLPGKLALNISPRQFNDPHFAERLGQRIQFHGISPHQLELELTETSVMTDPEQAMRSLKQLRAAGFSLSLDDFGMGYSSLTHLKGFPIDRIKLDRSFVAGMLEDPHDYAIVVATLAMASSLKLTVIAEGIENDEQVCALDQLGCRFAQGFLFGRPVDGRTFADRWLSLHTQAQHRLPIAAGVA